MAFLALARAFGAGWRVPNVRLPRTPVVVVALVVGAFGLVRNVPIEPLAALGT